MISASFKAHLANVLSTEPEQLQMSPLSGGDISAAYQINVGSAFYFLKTNSARRFPMMFECEAEGLTLLDSRSDFRIPDVISTSIIDDTQYLLLEFKEKGAPASDFWTCFGERLASMHKHTSGRFGSHPDNYIGSIPQSNHNRNSWAEFFIAERVEPRLQSAIDKGLLSTEDAQRFDSIAQRLNDIIPSEPPSLLHGDLWSGNFMCGSDGHAFIYDPAVYFGHREMDLAMSRLFGGFNDQFYVAYNEVYPMEVGWEERMDLHNLYPLLVHVELFGSGYAGQVREILHRFGR